MLTVNGKAINYEKLIKYNTDNLPKEIQNELYKYKSSTIPVKGSGITKDIKKEK